MAVVFMDLDGTLLDNGKPAANIVETITLLKANGHIPIIATGRVPHLLYDVRETLGIDSYIAANGNFIFYDGKVIHERYIPKNIVERLLHEADNKGFDLAIEGARGYVAYRKETDLVRSFSEVFHIEEPIVDRNFTDHNEVLAFVVFEDDIVPMLRDKFPELVFNRSNRFGYDVNLHGGLKVNGVRFMIEYLKLSEDDVYAIGDGYNDIDMLASVKNSIAMGNAYPEVKAVCKYITASVNEDGVRKAMEHFGLI